MQDDYFPSFFNIRLINETSFKELYGFYFYMIGKDACQPDTGIFRAETDGDGTLPDGSSGLNYIIRK